LQGLLQPALVQLHMTRIYREEKITFLHVLTFLEMNTDKFSTYLGFD
jgi:hypothetical protein